MTLFVHGVKTVKDLHHRITSDYRDVILDHACRSDAIYYLIKRSDGKKIIMVAVVKRSRGNIPGESCLGYKLWDEECEPYFYDCPKRILKQSECNSPSAIAWREKCATAAKQKIEEKAKIAKLLEAAKSWEPGRVIRLENFGDVKWARHYKGNRFAAYNKNGHLFAYKYADIIV